MADTNQPIRTIIFTESEKTQNQIVEAFQDQDEYQLIHISDDSGVMNQAVNSAEPELILVDYDLSDEQALDMIDELSIHFPDIPVVALLPEDNPLGAQRVMLAGARAFLLQPFTQINLLTTLRRAQELQIRNVQAQTRGPATSPVSSRTLGTYAVFSPRGGVGSTTVATNLALALMEQTDREVLLLDGKQFFGHVDVMLNLRSRNSIVDLIPHAGNLDEGLIRDVITSHVSGLNVLLGPSSLQVAQGVRPEELYNVLTGLQRVFDYVVIDVGNSLSENAVTLLDSAFRVLLLMNPDLASLRDIRQFLEVSQSLAYPKDKLLIVLNRAGLKGAVSDQEIESAVQHKLFASIPNNETTPLRSLNRGVPLFLKHPRNPISKVIRKMAKGLIEQAEEELATPAFEAVSDDAKQEALKKSSLLG